MDYSNIEENIQASRASDLLYAKWYAAQPNDRKSNMILSGYNFAANNIKQQVKKENPFATNADVILRFIEISHKADCTDETFAFIVKNMNERSEKEWKERFKVLKKELHWSYDDMARFMGAENGTSVKASINRKLPAFAKLAVCIFEQMNNQKELNKEKFV
jgi:hypothetical protein